MVKHGGNDQVFLVGQVAHQQGKQVLRLLGVSLCREAEPVVALVEGRKKSVRRASRVEECLVNLLMIPLEQLEAGDHAWIE